MGAPARGSGRRLFAAGAARKGWCLTLPLVLALAALLGSAGVPSAQSVDTQVRAETRRAAAPARPRPRPTAPRDRAYMDGGMVPSPGFTGFGATRTAPAPQAELAPRPNNDLEYRPSVQDPQDVATISPTLINPSLPGRGAAAHGAVNQREQRFLDNPAAGARFSVPMSW